MAVLVLACLSQKGGVGKSTLARLMAVTYATGDWRVKIADFNVKQKTAVDWAAVRMSQGIKPEIQAEAYTDVSKALRAPDLDMLVFDGKPDSDTQTLRLAQEAHLILVPVGVSADDLVPQVRFGQELKMRGVDAGKILFVLNKITESAAATKDARNFVTSAGFSVAEETLQQKTAYVNAHNSGRALAETEYGTLNKRAARLAQEVINRLNALTAVPA